MPVPVGIEVEYFKVNGSRLGVARMELHRSFETALGCSCDQLGLGELDLPSVAEVRFICDDGRSRMWARSKIESLSLLDGWFKADARMRGGDLIYGVDEQSCSMRLSPDFGGASVWTPDGACSAIDGLRVDHPHELKTLCMDIDAWQGQYEGRCDSWRSDENVIKLEWAAFNSKAAALALRSAQVLEIPLHVQAPYESLSAEESKPGWIWLPEWMESDCGLALELSAGDALAKADEDLFMEHLADGARQSENASMPWSIYCAHMGLRRAMSAIHDQLGMDSIAKARCAWGASALDAAVFAMDEEMAKALLSWGCGLDDALAEPSMAHRLVDSRRSFDEQTCISMARLFLTSGLDLKIEMGAKHFEHEAFSGVKAEFERFELSRAASLAPKAKGPKAL